MPESEKPGWVAPDAPPPANESAAEWVSIATLTEWAENPRKITELSVGKVAASIHRFGFASPIIARPNGEIIAGHTRYRAAKKLGLDRVPVRFMDLDPADAKMLAIADNRTNEETNWDEEKLSSILADMRKNDTDLMVLGFSEFELADSLKGQAELEIGAPRIRRAEDSEPFRFRIFKLQISKVTAGRFEAALKAYTDERGTTNGFVEFLCALVEDAGAS